MIDPEELIPKKTRGRKKTNNMYWDKPQEKAVVDYFLTNDNDKRNLIYNEFLKVPLNTMIDSIIRKYNLYRKNETFEDLHADTLSFLMTKAEKFNPEKGTKAYSYYGTICKHYILGLLIKDEKQSKVTMSYEDISSEIEEREDQIYMIEEDRFSMDDFIKKVIKNIRLELINDDNEEFIEVKKMNDNEKKVGYALVEILENWETAFDTMKGGAKYNKNSVLETMRNYTNLTTKDIRIAMKRFKDLYAILKLEPDSE